MQRESETLAVTTLFESPEGDEVCNQNYRDVILRILQKILPSNFFTEPKDSEESLYSHQNAILKRVVPLITSSQTQNFPGTISFFALSRYRSNAFKFFFEMISRWLAPGKRLNVVLVYATDFRLNHFSDEVYTICEVMIRVDDQNEFEQIRQNFPIIGTEISLGIHSEFYAQRILEIKGLSTDDKTASIQGFIAYLMKRFPKVYDNDVFTEMQHILVTCRDDFKASRQARHLSRLISIQYLFKKSLRESIRKKSSQRYINLKILRALIRTAQGFKRVLGVLVGLNFLQDREIFGEKHLVKALQHFIPNVVPIENSFFIHQLDSENICISYIEIEKKDGSAFSSMEIRKLRRVLPAHLKNRVEQQLHPVFMPTNEEEVIRNIVTLANQLQYARDIPQVLVNFDEQADAHLYFKVVMVRILKPGSLSVSELFKSANKAVEYLHDRTKEMDYVRKKYVKEAVVFRLKLAKEGFLRLDHSIDLHKARQVVLNELKDVVGEVRDYNGGMLSKQDELLSTIRSSLVDVKDLDDLLLENFFYSLSPVIVRTLLEPKIFVALFLMLIEGLKDYKQEGSYLKLRYDDAHCYVLAIGEDPLMKDFLQQAIQELDIPPTEFACAHVKTHGNFCCGYVCWTPQVHKQKQFSQAIEQTLKHYSPI